MSSQHRLPTVLDSSLYETKVLQLRADQTERGIDQQCEEDATALGMDIAQLKVSYSHQYNSQSSRATLSQSPSRSGSRTSQSRRSHSTDTAPIFHDCQSPTVEGSLVQPNCEAWRPNSPLKIAEPTEKIASTSLPPRASNPVSSSQEDNFQQRNESSNQQSVLRKLSGIRQALVRLPIFKRSRSQAEQDPYSGCELCPLYEPLDLTIFRLPCQHSYCTYHIRQIISGTSRIHPSNHEGSAQCCGEPIAERFISAVTSKPEDERLTQSMQSLLSTDSSPCTTQSTDQNTMMRNLDRAMEYSDFRLIRSQQEAERDRFLEFYKAQKNTLSALHDGAFYELVEDQAKETDDMKANFCQELSNLEDRQLAAEMEQHEHHKDERLKVEIALKHMERYFQSSGMPCSSSCPSMSSSDHANLQGQHKPSQRDYLQLMRQRWLRDNLERRHESAINVTRGQQARAFCQRREQQRAKLADLGKEHGDAQGQLDKALEEEDKEFEKVFLERKLRMVKRWNVSVAVWASKQSQSGVTTPGQIAVVEWPSI